jgi:hypothetical protein
MCWPHSPFFCSSSSVFLLLLCPSNSMSSSCLTCRSIIRHDSGRGAAIHGKCGKGRGGGGDGFHYKANHPILPPPHSSHLLPFH